MLIERVAFYLFLKYQSHELLVLSILISLRSFSCIVNLNKLFERYQ